LTTTQPVDDWALDFDVLDARYLQDPFSIFRELRSTCPIAHTNRRISAWLPLRYDYLTEVTHDVEHFSSRETAVIPYPKGTSLSPDLPFGHPPLTVDPPMHTWTRRLLLPWFSHQRVESYEPLTRELCRGLLDRIASQGHGNAAADYAKQIPVRVVAHIMGVPSDLSDTFTEWVRDELEFAHIPERRARGNASLIGFFRSEMERRERNPGDDLLSYLLKAEVDGQPIDRGIVLGIAKLVLMAGIDTTWSTIGASLWHLATHGDDRRRLVAEPELLPVAVEEFLRAYAPVTVARVVTSDIDFQGCPMKAGDQVLLNFAAANRDPEVFENPDELIIDRAINRHITFGSGIHRCAGSNLARMELRVALEEWLRRIPEFHLEEGAEVTWANSQIRGPRSVPLVFG
jgi:cytochrome P450